MFLLFVALAIGSLALAAFYSPWWLILTAVSVAAAAANAKSLPARKVRKFGVDLTLFEPPSGLSFAQSFDDAVHYIDSNLSGSSPRAPVGLQGSFRWIDDIAARVVGTWNPGKYTTATEAMAEKGARMRREAQYLGALTVYCAGCETKMSRALKTNALARAEADHLGADAERYIVMVAEEDPGSEPMPTREGRCPRCKSDAALFVWIP